MMMKKWALLLIAFVISINVFAQQAPIQFSFNHVALSVKNLDSSAAFYKNVMAFSEITNKSKVEGIRWFSLGEGKELHLISIIKEKVQINKAVHLALSTSTFDAFVAYLNKAKIAYSDFPGNPNKINLRADGVQQIFLQDPDGYWIEVNSVTQL